MILMIFLKKDSPYRGISPASDKTYYSMIFPSIHPLTFPPFHVLFTSAFELPSAAGPPSASGSLPTFRPPPASGSLPAFGPASPVRPLSAVRPAPACIAALRCSSIRTLFSSLRLRPRRISFTITVMITPSMIRKGNVSTINRIRSFQKVTNPSHALPNARLSCSP